MTIPINKPTLSSTIETTGSVTITVLLCYRIFVNTQLDFFLLSGITLLAVFYLWFGFFLFTNAQPQDIVDKEKRAAFTPFRITTSIIMGVVYSVSLISILYAIFFYPRMQFMLGFSFFLLISYTSFIIVYHWLNKNEWTFVKQFIKRSAILGAFVFFILVVPVEKRLEVLYRKHPGFVEAYIEYRNSPNAPETIEKLRDERSKFR